MNRRVSWLYLIPLFAFVTLFASQTTAAPQFAAGDVIISEVAWGGTASSSADEWIELYNTTNAAINLAGWQLTGGPAFSLTGSIPANGFYLLERTDDNSVGNIVADQIYTGSLSNGGQALQLRDGANTLIDTANGDGGAWPAGSGSPNFFSMERSGRDSADIDANWVSNDGITTNGQDASGNSLNATPKADNSGWSPVVSNEAELAISLTGPTAAIPGNDLTFTISLKNNGDITATNVEIENMLPTELAFVSETSGLPFDQTGSLLGWSVGSLAAGGMLEFDITVNVNASATMTFVNGVSVTTDSAESVTANNTSSLSISIPTQGFIINEINADPDTTTGDANGDGAISTSQDEFVELFNNTGTDADLSGWVLSDASGDRHTFPDNTILPNGCAIVVFGGGTPTGSFGGSLVQTASNGSLSLNNTGDTVTLRIGAQTQAAYTYSSEAGDNQSITRDPDIAGSDPLVQHTSASGSGGTAFSPGRLVNGTPFDTNCSRPDLTITKSGPSAATSAQFSYTIDFTNQGTDTATGVIITDTLPAGLTYVSDTSSGTFSQPSTNTLVWEIGTVAAQELMSFELTVSADSSLASNVTNQVEIYTPDLELSTANNNDSHDTIVGEVVLINAAYTDAYETTDEGIQLINLGATSVNIGGWQLGKVDDTTILPAMLTIPAGETIWIANNGAKFTYQFGFAPHYDANDLSGAWPSFLNDGDEVMLFDQSGNLVDTLVYGDGTTTVLGWSGAAVQAYEGSSLPKKGQVYYRMRDQLTGLPVPDTNTAADWAQSTDDIINGRKVRFPGWDIDQFFFPAAAEENAFITIGITPDNGYSTVKTAIDSATTSLEVQSLVFTNFELMNDLIAAVNRGVAVDVMLEGSPAGGIDDQELYLCERLHDAGGQCWFVINETGDDIYDRYTFMHAKFILIDRDRVVISSDNFTHNSFPYDDFSDGTSGRRGSVIVTDAPTVVQRVSDIWDTDFDPTNHAEVFPWTANHPTYGNKYGEPPTNFIPETFSGGYTYTVRYPSSSTFNGTFDFEVVQAPETSLRDVDSLLGLLAGAGAGDTIYVQQLNEQGYWGPVASNAILDPNPRLEAYIDAARRGADVWIMLDEYFLRYVDETDTTLRNNAQTCNYVNEIGKSEGLQLRCQTGLPADLGIHNKMILVEIDGEGYIHIGSINGSEQSNKGNRELALQVQSNEAYAVLANMFIEDWPHRQYLPVIGNQWTGRASYVLISEILYNSPGPGDEAEFIEIANPTGQPIDISNFSLGDAVSSDDFEDVKNFPSGTIIQPLSAIVVAFQADAFFTEFGMMPDFELIDTEASVPNMIDNPAYGDPNALLRLGNSGDEVILRDNAGFTVDAVSYGNGSFPGVVPAPLTLQSNRSLERFPYYLDSNDGTIDFREVVPTPSILP